MSSNRQRPASPAVGVDVGGTWVRIVGRRDGRTIVRASVPANRVPELGIFLRSALARFPRPSSLVVASRGVWTIAERRHLAQRLRGLAARVQVISDAQAALLGALGDRPGVLLLAGTGSIALAHDAHGRWARAGGLGPLLGDEGSAFWIGRQWLRAMSEGEDFMPARRILRAPDAMVKIAALAPRVIARARAGDRRARVIVREAQEHLAGFAGAAARKLRLRPPVAASWAGRLLVDEWFRRGVVRALARAGLRARWYAPASDAVTAAADMAEKMARRDRTSLGAPQAQKRASHGVPRPQKRAGLDAQ